MDAEIPGVHGTIPGVEHEVEHVTIPDNDPVTDMDTRYGPRAHSHDLWPRKPRDYSHLYADLEHTVMTQYSTIKKGLKMFGEAGATAP